MLFSWWYSLFCRVLWLVTLLCEQKLASKINSRWHGVGIDRLHWLHRCKVDFYVLCGQYDSDISAYTVEKTMDMEKRVKMMRELHRATVWLIYILTSEPWNDHSLFQLANETLVYVEWVSVFVLNTEWRTYIQWLCQSVVRSYLEFSIIICIDFTIQ